MWEFLRFAGVFFFFVLLYLRIVDVKAMDKKDKEIERLEKICDELGKLKGIMRYDVFKIVPFYEKVRFFAYFGLKMVTVLESKDATLWNAVFFVSFDSKFEKVNIDVVVNNHPTDIKNDRWTLREAVNKNIFTMSTVETLFDHAIEHYLNTGEWKTNID